MYILLISSTEAEISETRQSFANNKDILKDHQLNIAITGIGGTLTAYALTSHIRRRRPDYIIQAGIAGSFSDRFPPGSTALVNEEAFGDLGALENNQLRDIFDLGLLDGNSPPFTNRLLPNPRIHEWQTYPIPVVRGASVNAISSSPEHVDIICRKYAPAIESMEGAAFHYVCLMENIPFIQLRAISNYAGERNKINWKMKEAINNLNNELAGVILAITARENEIQKNKERQ